MSDLAGQTHGTALAASQACVRCPPSFEASPRGTGSRWPPSRSRSRSWRRSFSSSGARAPRAGARPDTGPGAASALRADLRRHEIALRSRSFRPRPPEPLRRHGRVPRVLPRMWCRLSGACQKRHCAPDTL